MVLRLARRFDQLLDDMRRRGMIGIPHAKVDNVLACSPCFQLHFVEGGEEIRREPLDTCEFHKRTVKPFYSGYLSLVCGRPKAVCTGIVDFPSTVKHGGTERHGRAHLSAERGVCESNRGRAVPALCPVLLLRGFRSDSARREIALDELPAFHNHIEVVPIL